jgi:hypothetical protein
LPTSLMLSYEVDNNIFLKMFTNCWLERVVIELRVDNNNGRSYNCYWDGAASKESIDFEVGDDSYIA